MNKFLKDKVVLVTGGTGSIGSALVREILKQEPKQVRIFSRNDSRQYHLIENLGHPKNVRALIGDIRDLSRLELALENVQVVFHAAALKHVSLCEYNPLEAVKTNILGSQNVIDASFKNKVEKVVAISTDKAANPGSVMGLSKLMMEKLFTNTSYFSEGKTKLSCVRFGNVAWSEASVLPLWRRQAEKTGQINLTDREATRFFMSISQATQLVLTAAELTKGGETFIFKMPSVNMADLAEIFLKKHFARKKVKVKLINKRPGDKTHEDLFDFNDSQKLVLENHRFFIILPKETRKETGLYTAEGKYSDYEGFNLVNTTGYSSQEHLNQKMIEKLV